MKSKQMKFLCLTSWLKWQVTLIITLVIHSSVIKHWLNYWNLKIFLSKIYSTCHWVACGGTQSHVEGHTTRHLAGILLGIASSIGWIFCSMNFVRKITGKKKFFIHKYPEKVKSRKQSPTQNIDSCFIALPFTHYTRKNVRSGQKYSIAFPGLEKTCQSDQQIPIWKPPHATISCMWRLLPFQNSWFGSVIEIVI